MRTFVIGDIHGCLDEYRDLVDLLRPTRGDRFILCGDLLDKGPDSPGVVRYARELGEEYETILTLGNHEERHARYRKHRRIHLATGKRIPMQASDELVSITDELSDADVEFLESARLYVPLPEYDAIVVHAGIPPKVESLLPEAEIKALSNTKREGYMQMCRVRHVRPDGSMVPFGEETEEDVLWPSVYDGRFGHALYGHHPHRQPEAVRWPHATGLDLACVFGGWLAAMVLEGDRRELVTVPARAVYSTHYVE